LLKLVYKFYLIFYQKYSCQAKYPALTGYPVSGFRISRISGRPDIRQKQYPVHPYPKLGQKWDPDPEK
jgi:hypothetical protein